MNSPMPRNGSRAKTRIPAGQNMCARYSMTFEGGLLMAHKRSVVPIRLAEGDALTAAMAGIGMKFAVAPARDPNIEDTIFAASCEGMERDDLRVLAVLVTWLDVHSSRINADRVSRLVSKSDSARVRAFW